MIEVTEIGGLSVLNYSRKQAFEAIIRHILENRGDEDAPTIQYLPVPLGENGN